ncbi:MAG TPA: GNAT family N-acetyltransferase [Acidimicrobiales bacterium]|nr:GNAT family N-acetyltransferase [Acidimicrobiales bacterium]
MTADTEPGAPSVEVYEATEVTDELVESFARLVPQLSSSSAPTSRAELAEIAASEATVLFMARSADGRIVGSLTLAMFRIPTGFRAWIEDVVVDDSARGAGVGEALVAAAVDRARSAGAKTVDLTSRPSRESANRLYLRLGFEARSTNVYRMSTGIPTEGS